jgi:hypothetical protein
MGEIKGRLAYAAWAMLASWLGLDPAQEAVADQPGKILNVWPPQAAAPAPARPSASSTARRG